jgi:hypothetical protein
MCAETRGPGDNSTQGNHRRIEAGRYPLRTQDGEKYVTIGYRESTNMAIKPRPGIAVDKTKKRVGIIIHLGRGFLSSIGCINPAKSLAQSKTDIDFVDSRKRVVAIINDMKRFRGHFFSREKRSTNPECLLDN